MKDTYEEVKNDSFRGNFIAVVGRRESDRKLLSLMGKHYNQNGKDRKKGRKEGRKEGRKKGRKEGRVLCLWLLSKIMVFLDSDYRVQLVPIPLSGRPTLQPDYKNFVDFYRSDHFQFWNNEVSFSALMITDTANFRGYMDTCYHKKCGDLGQVKDDDLEFLRRTINAVIPSVLDLSGGAGTSFILIL